MENIVLQTEHLCKKYGSFTALDDINITLRQKHIYGFIGENGAGKTTLMKILTGLAHPTSGSYAIRGEKGAKEREKMRKSMGSTIEAPALYPGESVYRNLELQRILTGNPDRSICDSVLEMLGLSEHKNKKGRNLSTGMKQRLGLALALVGNPQILILDEPTNGLDPQNLAELRSLLKKLSEERNVTEFISSHILSELYLLATDYIIIHKGKIVDVLTHEELETKCRQYLRISTKNVPLALTVLDRELENPQYKVVSDSTIHLYSHTDDRERIAGMLMKENVVVTELFVSRQTLEEYFLSVTGGVLQ
ncbi:MAG: ABC transporter ATP-binding protein [Roseburia sp.]|nr:ABC transporter ATP-binding protein [Roseburia sp.]MCM1243236.1 ABC transporter ATP-binding protein [Roseburia sp.]